MSQAQNAPEKFITDPSTGVRKMNPEWKAWSDARKTTGAVADVGGVVPTSAAPGSIPPNAQLKMGLSWDKHGTGSVDLDAACSVFDSMGLMLDCCFFNNVMALNGAMTHSGDSTDGAGAGEDEVISIQLNLLPPHALAIMLTIHCYEKNDFRSCESSIVQMYVNGAPLLTHSVGGMGSNTSAVVLIVQRATDGSWGATPLTTTMPSPIRTPLDALPVMLSLLKVDPVLQKELAGKQPVLLMRKGDHLLIPVNMTHIGIGLGWDSRVDVDGSAICLDNNSRMTDMIWFRNLTGCNGAIKHSGDNTTGAGAGDDETIKVNISDVPAAVTHIFFVINVFSGGNFSNVQGEYARLVNFTGGAAGKEFCRVNEMDSGSMNGFLFAVLYRNLKNPAWWHYAAVGEHARGNVATELVDECQAWQQRQPKGPRMFCKIVGARNLKACDSNGFSDPYVKVKVSGQIVLKTKVVKKSLNPTWNETFEVKSGAQFIDFTVMDEDTFSDDAIGTASFVVTTTTTGEKLVSVSDKGTVTGQLVLLFELK